MTEPARPTHLSRAPALSRAALLAGVSLAALAATAAPSAAGQPAMFSAQWFAARAQAAGSAAAAGQVSGTAQAAQSIADLTKMATAIVQAQALQAAARAAATAATVPDGLAAGGLAIATGAAAGNALWIGADLPTQSGSGGETTVTVTQTQPQALLNWQSFNVGPNTTLAFDQTTNGGSSAATWVALNKVPASVAPSQILGQITAAGKVYLINQSGIIFGPNSQVNVGSLIASTANLPVSITPAAGGVPASVTYSIYGAQSGSTFLPSFVNSPANSTVDIEAGAQIVTEAPSSAASGGGYAMFFGGAATNAGSIVTPDGQSLLASGQSFVLRQGYSTTANQTATTLGSQVAISGSGGITQNLGIVTATDGDITLVGHDVVQAGVLLATTSVNERGTVHLLTSTADHTAGITLAPGSVTAVMPDDSQATALDSQRSQLIAQSASLNVLRLVAPSSSNPQLNDVGTLSDQLDLSRIEITTGGSVEFGAGSLTIAQGGQIAVQATGRVQTDSTAVLDVAGQLNVALPMSNNDLTVSIESFQLRDAPVNNTAGSLDGENVYVDARDLVLVPASTLYPTDRYYTGGGLLEVSGYLDTTGHTIGEWTAVGGTITIAAGQVVAQTNSVFNISGGSLAYQAGMLATSYLVSTTGQIYNVNSAPADITYAGVYTGQAVDHPAWGVSETYVNPLLTPAEIYQPGYVVGRDAGNLTISAPTAIFEGAIVAGVVNGPYQTAARPAGLTDGYAAAQNVVPQPGGLAIGSYDATGLAGALPSLVTFEATVPALADSLTIATPIPADRLDTVWLSTEALSGSGLGSLAVASSRSILVADSLTLAPGGALSLVAPSVTFAADVTARGGKVWAGNILTADVGGVSTTSGLGTLDNAIVGVAAGVTIDTHGEWTNAYLDPSVVAGEAFVNGGSVTLDSTGRLQVAAGSLIDVSSGAALLAGGKLLGGAGGNVTLIGNDPSLAAPGSSANVSILGSVASYGVTGGGTLTIVGQNVAVGNTRPVYYAVWLDPAFFTQGFTTYDITGLTSVAVTSGATIAPAAPVYQLAAGGADVPTGSDPASALQLWLPPLYVIDPLNATVTQRQGVSLVLRSDAEAGTTGARGGSLTVAASATLSVDPGQSIRLEAYNQITVNGTVEAPGGTIAVVNMRQENFTLGLSPGFVAGQSVWIGAQSVLTAAAQAVVATDAEGQSFGVVPAGGTVILGAYGGSQNDGAGSVISTDDVVIVRPGAVVDASGASAMLDPTAGKVGAIAATLAGGSQPVLVASNGGTISLSSYDGIYIDGTLRASAGGAGGLGGTLALTLEAPLYAADAPIQPTYWERVPRTVLISQATTSELGGGALAPGQATPDAARDQARISVAQIDAGGFANLSVFSRDAIAFDGNVNLSLAGSIRFYQGIIGETNPAATVSLSAPYVLLSGETSHTADNAVSGISVTEANWLPYRPATTATLSISADLIEIDNDVRFGVQGEIASGNTSAGASPSMNVAYAGFSDIALTSAGDIRFQSGTFVTPGSVAFTAAQLYPTTEANAAVYAGVDYYLPDVNVVQAGQTYAVGQNMYAPGNAITITWNGVTEAAPYSAGGNLVLAAPTVEQGGVVRAPEGNITLGAVIAGPVGSPANQNSYTTLVELLPGSITSVSAAGQTIPFGGSADNTTYQYNGQTIAPLTPGITVQAAAFRSDSGATLDISGGGDLAGAVFQTGQGGSVDNLLQPFMSFTGTGLAKASLAVDPVYAIVPGLGAGYAPVAPVDQAGSYAGSVPTVGAEITLASSVDGLPAGTYALLPSYYALLPGAFRVQLDTASHTVAAGVTDLPDGSYLVGGTTGVANTGAQSALAIPVTLTPGSVVRTYSQYIETSYSQFQIAVAATTGAPRATIPEDAKQLTLIYPSDVLAPSTELNPKASTLPALTYNGVSDFAPAAGGYGSVISIEGQSGASDYPNFEIVAAGATPTRGFVTISAADLDALGASRLVIGGSATVASDAGAPTVTFSGQAGEVVVRGGAVLTAPEVFLVAAAVGNGTGGITIAPGATIDTVGAGAAPYDSTNGYYYNSSGYTVLAASNGHLNFTPDTSAFPFFGPISIADGATLLAGGTLAFSTTQGLTLGGQANYGAQYISLDVASVNILSTAVQNDGTLVTLPSGLLLSQAVLNRLLAGDPAAGVPGVTQLTLSATQSVNLFGGVALNTGAGAGLQQFVLDTPAIYGWSDLSVGGSSDVASISAGTGTLVWNGIAATVAAGPQTQTGSQVPGGFATTGLASGTGTLQLSGQTVLLGYPAGTQAQDLVSLSRTIVGFSAVDITATQAIEGADNGGLSVYAAPAATFGQAGTGGNLTLTAPLLTAQAGAVTAITAGGTLTLNGMAGNAATATAGGLGAEIDLTAASIALNGTVGLPSGRFTATAQTGISLSAGATLALAGQTATFFDQSNDTAGGTVVLATAAGNVAAAAGSTIDISAGQAAAGSLSVTAMAGSANLAGTIRGGAASGETQGSIEVRAQAIPYFALLNTKLTRNGVTGARVFELGAGSLVVDNELVANTVSLSVDSGSFTLVGTINASGVNPGTIDLSAANGLTIGAHALLDAHATVLHTDSYGAPIAAENTPHIVLTATGGTLALQSGASLDVASADGVARGQITLNAPAVGGDDIAISAGGSLNIAGIWTGPGQRTGSLAVYGWQSFTAPVSSAGNTSVVTQAWLDTINSADVAPFMTAAAANTALQTQLRGLTTAAHGAFHLRPGVEIDSGAADGGLTVSGDINLANDRYGASNAEPGAIVLRASGSLTVNGSITDGFAAPINSPVNPDDKGWVLFAGAEPFGADVVLPMLLPPGGITLGAGTMFPTANAVSLNYAIAIETTANDGSAAPVTLNQDVTIPASVKLAASGIAGHNGYVIPAGGWVATAPILNAAGGTVYAAGSVIPAGAVLQPGWTLGAGSVLPFQVNIPAGSIWPDGASLQAINSPAVTLAANVALPGGAFIPSGTSVVFGSGASQKNLRVAIAGGQQGEIWASAAMLPAGSMSWSIGLVSGADMQAASRFAVQPQSALGGGGNMILSDLHYGSPNQGSDGVTPSFSVIRTGTGNLTIVSGGDFTEYSLYGIYTAGSQTANVAAAFELPQAATSDGSVLGAGTVYNNYVTNYQAYYPAGGGNVLVAAQGGLYGDIYGSNSSGLPASDWVGDWLWRQGTGGTAGVAAESTAWWINFGTYVLPVTSSGVGYAPELEGFTGIGTLGGGNLTVIAGGNAGVTVGRDASEDSQGLDLAVASTGRVLHVATSGGTISGGTLLQTGGGDLTVSIGGTLNGLDEGTQNVGYDGLNGTFTDLRGPISISAGQIGRVVYQYGSIDPVDTRPLDPYTASVANEQGGLIVVPGDSQVTITTLRDLVLAGAGDAGRLPMQNEPGFTYTPAGGSAETTGNGGIASFSLWAPDTSITLVSYGGNVTPSTQPLFGALASSISNDMPTDSRFVYPPTLDVFADSGSIYYGSLSSSGTSMTISLELAPAPLGQMEMLARGAIYASGYSVDISGAAVNTNLLGGNDAAALPNPFDPAFTGSATVNGNLVTVSDMFAGANTPYSLFAFGADTATGNLHANDPQPARFYAVDGDIVDFRFGEILTFTAASGISPSVWYIAAKPAWIMAGRDIVDSGTRPQLDPGNPAVGSAAFAAEPNQAVTDNAAAITSGNLILNDNADDISVVSAGRDILSSYFYVAGPGLLEVDAGRNFDQMNEGMLKSLGPVFGVSAADRDGGAGIAVQAGTGSAGLDNANFAELYVNPANLANPEYALTAPQNMGKVADNYAPDLLIWLNRMFGYAGTAQAPVAIDSELSPAQQSALLAVYHDATALGGLSTTASPASVQAIVALLLANPQAGTLLSPTQAAQLASLAGASEANLAAAVTALGLDNPAAPLAAAIKTLALETVFQAAPSAAQADAGLSYFLGLPQAQQSVFTRAVFFDELLASGREESDPASRFYHSYVRGTEAIDALLPWTPAPQPGTPNYAIDAPAYASVVPAAIADAPAGAVQSYQGDVTMYSGTVTTAAGNLITNSASGLPVVFDAGISTQFGGNIQVIAPGGQILLGLVGGVSPGSNTGLITFGSGDIQLFSRGSVVLGQSRIFTTYGGNIQIWSATGNIDAGIGTKTSVVYQPPDIAYDALGDLTLAPTAPTNGSGIQSIESVAGVPPGAVDLVAPQGTIDSGEAGIFASGHLTLAALVVTGKGGIGGGGGVTGAPTVAVPDVAALQSAAATSGATENAAAAAADQQRRKRQSAESSTILVEVLGFGE